MQAVSTMKVQAPAARSVAARRQSVVVCAVQQQQESALPRRAALAGLAAAVLSLGVGAAEATQPAAKNSSQASMEGYNMEGTKKQGISAKRRKQLLAKLRESAGKK